MPLSYKSLSGSSNIAQYVTAANAATTYSATMALDAAIYTITCVSSTIAYVEFWNGSTYIGKAATVSGSTSYNLGTAATKIYYYTNTGSNVNIGIALTGANVSSSASGTLYTITSNQTFTETGVGYIVAVGGGAGGGGGSSGSSYTSSGGGGGSGGVYDIGYTTLTGNLSVVIGAAGSGGAVNTSGGNGNSTTIAGYTATGGSGVGNLGSGYNGGPGGAAGSPNGGKGGDGSISYNYQVTNPTNGFPSTTVLTSLPHMFTPPGTVGGGGGAGSLNGGGGSGAGSGIGTGGGGGGGNATGYGSGGGGGGLGQAGGNGSGGVVYILKLT